MIKDSTKAMFRKHGWRVDRFIHNYFYFLFYYPYVKISSMIVRSLKYLSWFKPLGFIGKMVFNRYHSKVLSRQDTVKIFTLHEDLRMISDENKRIIPFKYAHKIIFQQPDFIVVMDCPCKKSMNAPKEDLNSCLAVGKNIGSFWLEHCQKYNPKKISQSEALAVIDHFRKKKHITQAFFKVATGGSTGVICNCHPDTCVSLQATKFAKRIDPSLTMTAHSGYTVIYDPHKCRGCGKCADQCSFNAVQFRNGNRHYVSSLCLGCGLCVDACAEQAISLVVDPEKSLPLDVTAIKQTQ